MQVFFWTIGPLGWHGFCNKGFLYSRGHGKCQERLQGLRGIDTKLNPPPKKHEDVFSKQLERGYTWLGLARKKFLGLGTLAERINLSAGSPHRVYVLLALCQKPCRKPVDLLDRTSGSLPPFRDVGTIRETSFDTFLCRLTLEQVHTQTCLTSAASGFKSAILELLFSPAAAVPLKAASHVDLASCLKKATAAILPNKF